MGTEKSIKKQGKAITNVALFYEGGTGTLIGSHAGTLYKGDGGYVKGRGDSVSGVYYKGDRVKLQGTKYSGRLYDADGNRVYDTLYLGNGDYVTKVGSSAGTLYKGNGSSGYFRGDSVNDVYYKGNTAYLRGDEYTSPLFEPGTNFTYREQGDQIMVPLFYEGPAYSGGLYHDIELAMFTTREITALTI